MFARDEGEEEEDAMDCVACNEAVIEILGSFNPTPNTLERCDISDD